MANASAVRYRHAVRADAAAIAELHAESWRAAYRGMLPDAFLDNEVFADRAALWSARFDEAREQPSTITILAELDGRLSGFAHSLVEDDATFGTLLDNLHVRPGQQRSGIGTRLMAETAAWLEDRGHASRLYLWVLEKNARARRFYEALGGTIAERGISREGGGAEPCLRICWSDVRALAGHLSGVRTPPG